MRELALGQRLLPTTPEAASEGLPIRVAGGNYQLALDGRIDNREDVAVSLGIDLRRFKVRRRLRPAPYASSTVAQGSPSGALS